MIWIFNLEKASACACDSYNELFHYLLTIEHLKLEEEGATKSIIAADVGLAFIKQWCLDYCKSNNYVVVESFSQEKRRSPHESQSYSLFPEIDPSYTVSQDSVSY